jgi:C-terminal processing protease CtpA/Prc
MATTATPFRAADQSGHMSSLDQQVLQQMLKDAADSVRKNYYDPSLQGVDFNLSYQKAQQAIRSANNVPEGYEAIADMMADLKDSHTFFLPPVHPFSVEQGWEMRLIGDKSFVTWVKGGSDAATKGLKPGDQIMMVDGIKPSRQNWAKLQYDLDILTPRSSLHLIVARPGEHPETMVVANAVLPRRAEYDLTSNDLWWWLHQQQSDWHRFEPRSVELDNVMVWHLPTFHVTDNQVDSYMHKAGKYPALVLDLRGNEGGPRSTLLHLIGWFFDHDVDVAESVGRDKKKTVVAKSEGGHCYKGKLVVLLDSGSMSSSEVFARVMQNEKRGTVVGDRSAGRVREGQRYSYLHGQGIGHQYGYAFQVTTADVVMPDGKSLEGVGVTPDEVLLPTAEELAGNADPQLSRALLIAGAPVSSEKAGTLFPHVGP